ncbi:EamA-like transporter family protein [uncultured archaeon]|nr:EamA-like transporter family protein [uncultured archaeon]
MQRGYYLVFGTAVISGISIFLNKFAVKCLDPYFFTFSKNVLVAVFLFSMLLLMGEWAELKALKFKQWLQLIIIGLVGGSVPFLMFFKGLQLTSAATASFMHKTMFIYVAVLAAVFLKEKISRRFLVGALLLLLGNYLLVKSLGFDAGALLVFGATLLWAVENVISKYVLKDLSSRVVAFGRMFFGSLFIIVFLAVNGSISQILSLSVSHVEWVLFTSILLLLYVTTWYEGLRTIDVSTATCILLLGSVITTGLQFAFGDATPTIAQAIGVVLLIAGVVATVKLPSKQPALT